MSQDALRTILRNADAALRPVFGADDTAAWPEGTLDTLAECAVLARIEDARFVTCDGCGEGCLEEVILIDCGGDAPPDAFVACHRRSDIGRVRVPLERLRRWAVDVEGLVCLVGRELGAPAGVRQIIPDRLWGLGRPTINRRRVDLFFARGLQWPDADRVFLDAEHLAECSIALVIVPWDAPRVHQLGIDAKLLSLTRLLALDANGLHLDRAEIEAVVGRGRNRRVQTVTPWHTSDCNWSSLIIEFVRRDLVKIVAGEDTDHRDFADMGFRDARKGKESRVREPDSLWEFFHALALCDGCISWDDQLRMDDARRRKAKKQVSDLRRRLRAYFPDIPGDPFEPYRRAQAYKTRFILCMADSHRESLR